MPMLTQKEIVIGKKSNLYCEANRNWRGLNVFPIRGQEKKKSVQAGYREMFSIYSESLLIERTDLSKMLNGHWCGFRTKTVVTNRSACTRVDLSQKVGLLFEGSVHLGAEMRAG